MIQAFSNHGIQQISNSKYKKIHGDVNIKCDLNVRKAILKIWPFKCTCICVYKVIVIATTIW